MSVMSRSVPVTIMKRMPIRGAEKTTFARGVFGGGAGTISFARRRNAHLSAASAM